MCQALKARSLRKAHRSRQANSGHPGAPMGQAPIGNVDIIDWGEWVECVFQVVGG